MRKVLLGSSAIVAAALVSSHASAQGISFSGYVDFQAGGNVSGNDDARDYDFVTDTRLNIMADFVADNGLAYGAFLRLEDAGEAGGTAPNGAVTLDPGTNADFDITKGYAYVGSQDGGGFGQIRLGDDEPVAQTLRIVPQGAASGLADGDLGRYISPGISQPNVSSGFIYDSDDTKVAYYTPGFNLGSFGEIKGGVSYSPTTSGNFSNDQLGDLDDEGADGEDVFSIGANFAGAIGSFGIGVFAGANYGDGEDAADDDIFEWDVGASVATGPFTVSGFYRNAEEFLNLDEDLFAWGVGARYTFGPWGIGANFIESEGTGDAADDWVAGIGVDYSLAPGLTPYLEYDHSDVKGGLDADNSDVVLGGIEVAF